MDNEEKLTVSIAMCTYNGAKYLKDQLESILNQTVSPDEIIVCDDGSKDKSVEVAKNILHKWNGKWKVISNETNLGFKKNFQKAISLCTGDIIFLSDQDDVWNEKKIETMLPVFKDSNVVLAFHDATLVDENLELLYPSFWKTLNFDSRLFFKRDYRIVLAHNVMQGAACCFRKKLFQIAEPFPVEAIHDEWLLLVGLAIGKVIPVDKTLLQYRQAQNVLGGIPLTIKQKFLKWYKAFNKGMDVHAKYLNNRLNVFALLLKRTSEYQSNVFLSQLGEYNNFLARRIKYFNSFFNRVEKKEFYYWYFPQEAQKQWVKDWLVFFAGHKILKIK